MSILDFTSIREILDYNLDIGEFYWKIKPNRNIVIGEKAGHLTKDGYIQIGYLGKLYQAHHLTWLYIHGKMPIIYLDHINGTCSDNRIANLREATAAENMQNIRKAPKNSSHGFLGTYFDKDKNLWRSKIRVNGVKKSLGYFKTPEEASTAYIAAKRQYHPFNTL